VYDDGWPSAAYRVPVLLNGESGVPLVNRVQRRSGGCANWKYQLVEGWQTLGPA